MQNTLIIRQLPQQPYEPTWQAMKHFTDQRDSASVDELWLLEHPPVFTQGLAGKPEHLLNPHEIPVIQTDRGGQITYHGPGQLMLYALLDLKRLGYGPRRLVRNLEQVVIQLLAELGIDAAGRDDAPGVYVDGGKICSIGLRVRRGCSYHGIALNVENDLTPFSYINPCGFKGLSMLSIQQRRPDENLSTIRQKIIPYFSNVFGYTSAHVTNELAPVVLHDTNL